MNEVNVVNLLASLKIARNEINKLRQQVKALQHINQKETENIKHILKNYRCEGCKQTESNKQNENLESKSMNSKQIEDDSINYRPIGIIRTLFPEKRAVPRQTSVGNRLRGAIILNSNCFTNPEHSLEGLNEFSHLWIIYHFHKNISHSKAKVAPPRLDGERVGVFSTRSPHRPCPIGLSLVEIEKIEKSAIYFLGTDMVDGTPVLDIKPYIPKYDVASELNSLSSTTHDFYNLRQDPDGEESEMDAGAIALPLVTSTSKSTSKNSTTSSQLRGTNAKVPNWIMSTNNLKVLFNDRAEDQIKELKIDRTSIESILESDPRSVYLRTKHNCQIFTFHLSNAVVTCKFDDKNSTVTVVQVRNYENLQDESTDLKNLE